MKSKLLALLFIIYSLLFIIPGQINAQSQNPSSTEYYNTNPDVPNNLNTHVQSVVINVASTLSCILSGVDPVNPGQPCLGIDPTTKKLGYVEDNSGGLIGITGRFISYTYYIPVSTHDYGSYLAGNFGIAKPTYAQGVGFKGLTPVMKLWESFRDITYLIFVVLFIIIGLGIMFRIQIDPRTVMTLQNQIPKIIVALILVTFSYAIGGFLIDLMYLSMYIILAVFAEQGINSVDIAASSPFGAVGGIGGLNGIAWGVTKTISGIVATIFDGTIGNVIGSIIGGMLTKFLGGGISSIVPGGILVKGAIDLVFTGAGVLGGYLLGSQIVGWIAGFIAYIVITIAIFSALLRLWFILIKSYIYILMNVVFAPFIIAKGLIPGQSGIGMWLRSMIANLAVFPVTIIMFMLGKAFIEGFTTVPEGGHTVFVPPMVGNFADPEAYGAILGLAIVLMTPEVANMTKDALKAPDLKYSAAVGKGLGIGAAVPGSIGKGIGGQFFGEDRMGRPKLATKWVGDRFGGIARALTGGSVGSGGPGGGGGPLLPPSVNKFFRRRKAMGPAAAMARGSRAGSAGRAGTGGAARAAAAGTPPAGTTPPPPGTPPTPPAANTWPSGMPRTGAATMTEAELEAELDTLREMEANGEGDPIQVRDAIEEFEARLRERRGNP